jgi:hypothetical protein
MIIDHQNTGSRYIKGRETLSMRAPGLPKTLASNGPSLLSEDTPRQSGNHPISRTKATSFLSLRAGIKITCTLSMHIYIYICRLMAIRMLQNLNITQHTLLMTDG